jgi:hypothetical protein
MRRIGMATDPVSERYHGYRSYSRVVRGYRSYNWVIYYCLDISQIAIRVINHALSTAWINIHFTLNLRNFVTGSSEDQVYCSNNIVQRVLRDAVAVYSSLRISDPQNSVCLCCIFFRIFILPNRKWERAVVPRAVWTIFRKCPNVQQELILVSIIEE